MPKFSKFLAVLGIEEEDLDAYQHQSFSKIALSAPLVTWNTFFEWKIAEVVCFWHKTEHCYKGIARETKDSAIKSYEYCYISLNFLNISESSKHLKKISGYLGKGLGKIKCERLVVIGEPTSLKAF